MNALQKFISARPFGFVTDADMPELIALAPLSLLLVRCGGGRFLCPAQDLAHFIACVEAGKDYVRDVSFPPGANESAASWQPAPTERPAQQRPESWYLNRPKPAPRRQEGVDWICTGNFDGFTCGSDADSGL